jgi:malonate-semialdehyde dehydrogenase (acetylating)/methylmalonate-semialdehyde dehydrogenase
MVKSSNRLRIFLSLKCGYLSLVNYRFSFDFTGKAGIDFYTQVKTVTQQWKDLPGGGGINLAMPTSQKA